MFEDENKFSKQLSEAFGDKRAKELVEEIKEIKRNKPHTNFSFMFSEDGKLIAVEKKSPLILNIDQ